MTPTNELRFVEREINQQISKEPDKWERKTVRVLQQKWEGECLILNANNKITREFEWRDVPLVKEE